MKEQIAKTLNLDTTFKDNNIESTKENTVEISNIAKTVDISKQVQKEEVRKEEVKATDIDVESSEDDFELI